MKDPRRRIGSNGYDIDRFIEGENYFLSLRDEKTEFVFGDYSEAVQLEGIGLALLSKVEPYMDVAPEENTDVDAIEKELRKRRRLKLTAYLMFVVAFISLLAYLFTNASANDPDYIISITGFLGTIFSIGLLIGIKGLINNSRKND